LLTKHVTAFSRMFRLRRFWLAASWWFFLTKYTLAGQQ
jgi:hypothetical protein